MMHRKYKTINWVIKSQKILKAIYGILNYPKRNKKMKKIDLRPNVTIPQVEFFLFVFSWNEDTIICYRDLLTFRSSACPAKGHQALKTRMFHQK
jgi:hypothetical protein